MSAPDPKEWALTDDEAEEIESAVDLFGSNSPEFLGGFEMVARRRAIAELKAIATELLLMGCHPTGSLLIEIHKRIAAIEAEE